MEEGREGRPDPDRLLEQLERERRGRLVVFLGPAAGSGKTYAMLEAARENFSKGADLVIGWLQTHGREETETLAEGLPRIPPRRAERGGRTFEEMDLDALLARRPAIALVDELAHSDMDGRHERRYQDVLELLDAGIEVWTTLNVQHVESLNDAVARITGIVVRETVPDAVLDRADEIRLLDASPEVLRRRLEEGKVYAAPMAGAALERFFRPGNLNALRELALRTAAARVDQSLREYMEIHRIEGPWPAAERILVAVGPSPFSAQLVRAARRLAAGLKAEWLAVTVRTPASERWGEADRARLARNLRMAEDLGAEVISAAGSDVAQEVLRIARERHASILLLGKARKRTLRDRLLGGITDRIFRESGSLDVYAVEARAAEDPQAFSPSFPKGEKIEPLPYVAAAGLCGLITLLGILFRGSISNVNLAILYTLPIVTSALRWGRGPALLAATIGVLTFNFFFVPPFYTLAVGDLFYLWSFLLFFVIAFLVGRQAEQLREEARLLKRIQAHTSALYEASRAVAAARTEEEASAALTTRAALVLGIPCALLLPDSRGKLRLPAPELRGNTPEPPGENPMDSPSEAAVASWVMEHGQPAGRGTGTLPGGQWIFFPIVAGERGRGVFAALPPSSLAPEEREHMDALCRLAALGLRRIDLEAGAREAALAEETERLRNALLSSLSHELRTPLASLIGASEVLLDGERYNEAERRELVLSIREGALRMEDILRNLLDGARIESGRLSLKLDWTAPEELVEGALRRVEGRIGPREVETRIAEGLPLLRCDIGLIEHVLVNLLDNALRYSPEGSPLEMEAVPDREGGGFVRISLGDRGPGLSEEDPGVIFEKFRRGSAGRGKPGTGLGLTICRAVMEAHGGEIVAENRPGGGAIFRISLPTETAPGNGGGRRST
jgi:two-component system sensor histidine kinase KdpD